MLWLTYANLCGSRIVLVFIYKHTVKEHDYGEKKSSHLNINC